MARRIWIACLAVTTVAACAGSPANANAPGGSVSVNVEGSVPFRLYTHCGILGASINGRSFYADPPISDGSGNPRSGWGNPYDDGDMTLRGSTSADFHDAAGHAAHFTSAPGPNATSIPICS